MAGPYEFVRPGLEPPAEMVIRAMAEAYRTMGYTVGGLTPAEGAALEKSNVRLDNWQKVGALTKEIRVLANGIRVGFLFLPELPAGNNTPSPSLSKDFEQAAEELRKKTDLVAAVSPWGYFAEKSWLDNDPPHVDLLLGAGPGAGLNRLSQDGKTLWVRPTSKGKTLTRVDVRRLPEGRADRAWNLDDYTVATVPLGDSLRLDPKTDALFNNSNLNTKEGDG